MKYYHVDKWSKISSLSTLHDLKDPPKNLFAVGAWDPQLFENCVAVVGSRKMTTYGRQAIERLVPQLVLADKTIVSGFMYGVDQYAHQVCIESGGKTIAVLGWGITTLLEDQDKIRAEQIIASGGLLLSEWENQQPTLWTFPVRNRIVAALASEVYVVEAAEKSGSLLTANLAHKLKRELYAIPGPITSRTSRGTNYLIRTGIAKAWLGDLPASTTKTKQSDPLLNLIQAEPLTINEIARELAQPISGIGAKLSVLLVTGQVVEREGKYYPNYAH